MIWTSKYFYLRQIGQKNQTLRQSNQISQPLYIFDDVVIFKEAKSSVTLMQNHNIIYPMPTHYTLQSTVSSSQNVYKYVCDIMMWDCRALIIMNQYVSRKYLLPVFVCANGSIQRPVQKLYDGPNVIHLKLYVIFTFWWKSTRSPVWCMSFYEFSRRINGYWVIKLQLSLLLVGADIENAIHATRP